MGETTKLSSILMEAIKVNKKPFPWLKAFMAGVAAGLPVLIGILFNSLQYGLIAGLGGFAFLYTFPIPYAQLAKKLTWVVLAITACVFLGTITAPYPIAAAILMGVIGATATFIFGAFRLIGPSALFFVLIFAMTTGMPIAPEEAFVRAGLALLGGAFSWLLAMSGWFFKPHASEKNIVKRTYIELANFIDSIGTDKENEFQHRVMATLKEAEQTLVSGYIPWRTTDFYHHLYVLYNYSNKIFLHVVEHFIDKPKIPTELGDSLRTIARILDLKSIHDAAAIQLPQPNDMDEKTALLYMEITEAKNSLLKSSHEIKEQVQIKSPSVKRVILGEFDKNSIIFINSLRFGAFTILAAIIAYEFHFARSFWIPLSCVAVMSGATAVATFHRAIQRSFGTIFGIIIASLILALHPSGYTIALLIFLLTFITELFIVKNYGLAALFFTPNSLIMAEVASVDHYSFSYFASARIVDVAIGVVIGLIGVWFVGRKSASSKLPHLTSKTIRSQAQVFYALFSNETYSKSNKFNKMKTNINNLKTVYDTAVGEIPKDKSALKYYWPIIYTIQELEFLLDKCSRLKKRPLLDDETLAKYLLIFESIANASEHRSHTCAKEIPKMEGYPRIKDTIEGLQKSILSKSD